MLQQLVDAGAIVLGKTNLHELAFGITSTNLSSFAGPVKNPYDRTRIPGGSSGGTAVAIAARIVPAGLGTDTGGSTRIPAALCGIAGLRPSVGNGGAQRRYDGAGVVPISHTRDTIGPMGRSVADVALLDAAITGGAPAAARCRCAGLRIGVPASFWSGLEAQVDDGRCEAPGPGSRRPASSSSTSTSPGWPSSTARSRSRSRCTSRSPTSRPTWRRPA